MGVYLLFVFFLNGTQLQIGSFETMEECDKVAVKTLYSDKNIISVTCLLDSQTK